MNFHQLVLSDFILVIERNNMEAKAITRHIRQSPRKIRIILDEVRGCGAEEALNYLHFSKAKASVYIEKTLRSAISNLLNKTENSDLNTENIKVKECYADGGPHMKRFRAASMGRISKLNKPTAHLTVVVADNNN